MGDTTEKIRLHQMQAHKDQIEECKSVFVSWRWLVGILISAMVGTSIAAMTYANGESKQNLQMEKHTMTLTQHKEKLDKMEKRLDRHFIDIKVSLDSLLRR